METLALDLNEFSIILSAGLRMWAAWYEPNAGGLLMMKGPPTNSEHVLASVAASHRRTSKIVLGVCGRPGTTVPLVARLIRH